LVPASASIFQTLPAMSLMTFVLAMRALGLEPVAKYILQRQT
jgi:ABC-type proline/glycine betaine transport system permease subunit